jgi:hypothetical protein
VKILQYIRAENYGGQVVIEYLHCAKSLEKQLRALRRSGKKAEWAAEQCEEILARIRTEGLLCDSVYSKRTKNGEYRISNCVKYDLGNGYRMVTIRDGQHLYVPFIGGHDDTSLWLDRHKYDLFSAADSMFFSEVVDLSPKKQNEKQMQSQQSCEISDDPYEAELQEKLDDALLKDLFCGLYQKNCD